MPETGKNPDRLQPFMLVVAGALARGDGTWLMQRRPDEKHHGGLWEFPGGKVEPAEMPVAALIRELREELGITVRESACRPVAFAEQDEREADRPIVILLYTIDGGMARAWEGTPRALEGGAIGWFTPHAIAGLATPPLDRDLAARLFGDD